MRRKTRSRRQPLWIPRKGLDRVLFSVAFFFLAVALSLTAVSAQGTTPPGVRMSLVADRAELSVGDVVTLSLLVSHPADFAVVLPRLDRHWGEFEILDQTSVQTVSLNDGVREVAKQFRVTLFAPGAFETPDLPVSVRGPDGIATQVYPNPVQFTVNSVLSSPDEQIRDIRPPSNLSTPFWSQTSVLAIVGLLVVAFLTGLGLLLYRNSRRPNALPELATDLRTSWEIAYAEIDRIVRLGLPEKGDVKGHYTLLTDTLRVYLGATFMGDTGVVDATDMSTEEISVAIRETSLDQRNARLSVDLLQEADLVKFANYAPSASRANEVATLVRTIIDATCPAPSAVATRGDLVSRKATP